MLGKISGRISGLAKTILTLPAIVADLSTVNLLLDRYGRVRSAAESATTGNIEADAMGLADTTLPAAVGDGNPAQMLVDVYGRLRLAAENAAQDKILSEGFGLADTTLPAAVGDGDDAQLLTDVYGRLRLAAENAARDKILTEGFGLADTTLPAAVGDGDDAQLLTDVYGRLRLAAENAAQDKLLAEGYGLAKAALPAAVADGEDAQALTDLYGRLRLANENAAAGSNRTEEVDPLSEQFINTAPAELTNIASGTTDYIYVDMDGFRNLSLQIEIGAAVDSVTVTAWMSNEPDATPATATYQDVTLDLFTVADTVVDDIWVIDVPLACKYFRLRYVTAGGNNDADLTVFAYKQY
uniref:Uncharacterized protein n=1 Tax=viral metagenome TaxID=1070528 RepID=A0A6M3M860_9ZZZZ